MRSSGAAPRLAIVCSLALSASAAAGPLTIDLPEAAFAQDGATIAVDINGYDVTGFASLAGRKLEVELEPPLDPGEHSLAILLFLPDDSVEVIVETTIDVPVPAGTAFSGATTLQTDYRLAEEPAGDFGDSDGVTGSGSLGFEILTTGSTAQVGFAAETLFAPENDVTPGENWLLPGYTATVTTVNDSADAHIAAGTVAVHRDDLLFSGYERRGTEIAASNASGRFGLQAFTVNARPRNAFDGGYVLPDDPRERAGGVTAAVAVVPKRLSISAGFVDGKTPLGGAGFNPMNDPTVYGGTSRNLALDSRWLDDSLRLHLETAESEFDVDGIGIGLPEVRGDATRASLIVSSDGALGAAGFDFWSAVFHYRQVSRDFYSLGNLTMPGDLETMTALLQAGYASLVLDFELAREQTNADNDPLLPVQTLDRSGLTLGYTPATIDMENPVWQILGAPSVTGWFYRIENAQPDGDALLAGFDVDNTTDEAGLALAFSRETLTWSLEHNVVDYEDRSLPVVDGGFLLYEPPSDSRNQQTSVTAAWAPGERLSLEAYLQRNRFDETGFANRYRNINYGLGGTVVLRPGALSLSANLNRARDRNTFGNPQFVGEEFRARYASLQLNWFLREAGNGKPGLALYLNGSHGRNEDVAFELEDESWSVYLGGTVNWAGSH